MSTREDREMEVLNGEHADDPERVWEDCVECGGSGDRLVGDDYLECPECAGLGKVDVTEWMEAPYYEPVDWDGGWTR